LKSKENIVISNSKKNKVYKVEFTLTGCSRVRNSKKETYWRSRLESNNCDILQAQLHNCVLDFLSRDQDESITYEMSMKLSAKYLPKI